MKGCLLLRMFSSRCVIDPSTLSVPSDSNLWWIAGTKNSEFFSDVKDCDGKTQWDWVKEICAVDLENERKKIVENLTNMQSPETGTFSISGTEGINNKQTLPQWKMGDNLANLEPQMLQLNPPSPCACSHATEELTLFYWWLYCINSPQQAINSRVLWS